MFQKNLKQILLLAVFIALILRLIISATVFDGDVITQAEWGKWIYEHGLVGFYDENHWLNEWPNHPPLITIWYGFSYVIRSLIMGVLSNAGVFIANHHLGAGHLLWYFNFLKWFGSTKYQLTGLEVGIFYTIKLLPIVADILIALLIFKLAEKISFRDALFFSLAYLFLPFSFYLSAVWGQSDQVGALFTILSFLALFKGNFLISPILLAIAIDLKPTSILLLPLYFAACFIYRANLKKFSLGLVAAFLLIIFSFIIFTDNSYVNFILLKAPKTLFFNKTQFISINAFNFWYIFYSNTKILNSQTLFWVPAFFWSLIFFGIINLLGIFAIYHKDLKNLFLGIFIVISGGWLFLTNMYERYLFLGVLTLLILSIYNKKLVKYFLIFSTIYFLNLYHGLVITSWMNSLIDFRVLLSLINVIVFFRIIKLGFSDI